MSIKNNRLNNNNLLNSENNFIYNNQRIFSKDHLSKNGLFPTNENRTEAHKKFFQNTNNSDIFFQNENQSKSRNLSSKKYFKSNESDIFFQSPEKNIKNSTIKKAKKNVSNNIFQESNENNKNNKKIDRKNLRLYESDIFFQKEDKNVKKRPIKSGKKNNSKIGKNYEENKKIEGKKILKNLMNLMFFFNLQTKINKKFLLTTHIKTNQTLNLHIQIIITNH